MFNKGYHANVCSRSKIREKQEEGPHYILGFITMNAVIEEVQSEVTTKLCSKIINLK